MLKRFSDEVDRTARSARCHSARGFLVQGARGLASRHRHIRSKLAVCMPGMTDGLKAPKTLQRPLEHVTCHAVGLETLPTIECESRSVKGILILGIYKHKQALGSCASFHDAHRINSEFSDVPRPSCLFL